MKELPFLEDIRDIRDNWHDPEYRKGFLIGFASAFGWRLFVYGLLGLFIGYSLSRLFG